MRDLLSWKTPLLSSLAMLQMQLLVSYPALVPAAIALTPVFFLHRNLMLPEEERDYPLGPICAQPSVASLLCSLLLGKRPKPLTVEPAAPSEQSEWMYDLRPERSNPDPSPSLIPSPSPSPIPGPKYRQHHH